MSKVFDRSGDGCFHFLFVRYIRSKRHRLRFAFANSLLQSLQRCYIAPNRYDSSLMFRETKRDSSANSRSSSGYENDLIGDIHMIILAPKIEMFGCKRTFPPNGNRRYIDTRRERLTMIQDVE